MAYIRKFKKKWQAQVRKKKIFVSKSFHRKSDASKWAYKTEAQIETGSYRRVQEAERIADIRICEVLNIYYEKHFKQIFCQGWSREFKSLRHSNFSQFFSFRSNLESVGVRKYFFYLSTILLDVDTVNFKWIRFRRVYITLLNINLFKPFFKECI